jgi:hypothetical protein
MARDTTCGATDETGCYAAGGAPINCHPTRIAMIDEVHLIYSEHCQTVSRNGKTVKVEIYSSGKSDWILEVVDADGNSTVWDDTFPTDAEAYAEFQRTLDKEGIDSMIGLDH